MGSLWPLMQEELARLLPQLQRLAEALAAGDDATAAAQWHKRLAGFQGATRVLGDTPLPVVVERLQGAWKTRLPRDEAAARAGRWLRALADIAGQEFDAALPMLAALRDEAEAVPAPTPEPPAPADVVSPRLLALFAVECDDKCNAMERVLLQLEQARDRLELIAPLMRAAHSIKGAARAVRNEAAVQLAHAFEDRFSAAQRQPGPVDEALVDLALRAVDRLRRLGRDDSPDSRAAAAATRDELLLAAVPAAAATALPKVAATYIDVEDADPILRVRASHVGRLIALAGTSMVESRRLRLFGERQQRLRRGLGDASRQLDELHHALGAPGPQTPVGSQLATLRGQLSQSRLAISHWLEEFGAYEHDSADLSERLYHHASQTRLRPFADIAEGYARMVRDLGRQLGKRVHATLSGEQLAVDRDVLERLDAPLTHLLRNAVDHGVETLAVRRAAGKPEEGVITVAASYRAGMLAIDVQDDGAGIDYDRVRERLLFQGMAADEVAGLGEDALADTLFAAGFSTRDEVSETSGRGVGLDVVRQMLKQLDGSVRVSSVAGRGTRFSLLVPISRAVTRAVAVEVAGETYAFPLLRIERLVRADTADLQLREGMQYLALEGRNIGLLPLAELLSLGTTRPRPEGADVVVIGQDGRQAGFVVDAVLGEFDLSTRPLDPRLGRVADLAAIALMPDGSPVVLLDTEDLMRGALERERVLARLSASGTDVARRHRRVLVVDDSISVRELVRQLLAARGYEVEVAVDGMDAWARLREWSCDLVVTDVDMPRMDGIELTRSIKQDPRLRELPVVIVSYRDRPEDRARGLEVHADAYLTKADFQEHGFLDVVHSLIGDAEVEE